MNAFALTTCIVSLVFVAYVWFYEYERLRRDDFRADIRRVRDGLFDFMVQNGYDLDTPPYLKTRETLNDLLRLSNQISLLKFMIVAVHVPAYRAAGLLPDDDSALITNLAIRGKIEEVRNTAAVMLLRFVFFQGTRGLIVRLLAVAAKTCGYMGHIRDRFIAAARSLLMESHSLEASAPSCSDRVRVMLHH